MSIDNLKVEAHILKFANTLNDYKKYLPEGVGNIIYNEAYNAVSNVIYEGEDALKKEQAKHKKKEKKK